MFLLLFCCQPNNSPPFKGNASFLTNENRAPDYAEEGGEGEQRQLHLEMRTIADVGLIGFPNAGLV